MRLFEHYDFVSVLGMIFKPSRIEQYVLQRKFDVVAEKKYAGGAMDVRIQISLAHRHDVLCGLVVRLIPDGSNLSTRLALPG